MSSQPSPEISIILVAGSKRERASNALASILRQAEIEQAEIILIDLALDQFPPLAGSDHPQVRMIQMGYELHIGEIRAYAVRVARSPLVAFLEEHALALPGWLKETLATFRRGDWAAVAGAVVGASPNSGWGPLLNSINFYRWTEDAPSGELEFLPGHNTAYRRDLLLSAGDDLSEELLIELTLQQRLREQGYKLYFENRIRWIHLHENRADRLFANYFSWNVAFGRQRVRGRSRAYRILRILTTPLIFPVRMAKSLLRLGTRVGTHGVGTQGPGYAWLLSHLVLIHLTETLGLGTGYLGVWKNPEKVLTVGEVAMERESPPHEYNIWQARNQREMLSAATK